MRIRIKFEKKGALKYIGHLDLHKIWERSARRANITLAYSQGFHPQPKIQLASALPLGFSSSAEVVDLWTVNDLDLQQAKDAFQKALPTGIIVVSVDAVDNQLPPLQTEVIASEYLIDLSGSEFEVESETLKERIQIFLDKVEIQRERRGKSYNLRPLTESIIFDERSKNIFLKLSAREGATGRPEEVLAELGIPFEEFDIERKALLFR